MRSNRARDWNRYWSDRRSYLSEGSGEKLVNQPCINDWSATMPIEPIYYYQDAWAFERILAHRPAQHIDVGSHHKLVSLLSKAVPTATVDIRPLSVTLDSLQFIEGSILDLPFEDHSLTSVSSICVVEHIGLGRYGDPIDTQGSIKAANELQRVLAPGGHLFVSLPIDDTDKVYFNAHRAFTEQTILRMFSQLELLQKRYIFDDQFVTEIRPGFGTGCYEFRRPLTP